MIDTSLDIEEASFVLCSSLTSEASISFWDQFSDSTQIIVFSDPNLNSLHLPLFLKTLPSLCPVSHYLVPAGESCKTLECYQEVLGHCLASGCDKGALLVAFGGGALTDLVGFVAATYLRGVRVAYVPTTLLAQVDAAVGGKTAINLGSVKNSVGCIREPDAVLFSMDVLQTLPTRDFRAAFAEIIKYGLALDAQFFDWLEQNIEAIPHSVELLKAAIRHCLKLKRDVVALDPYETKGYRWSLNFGHTLGHALESVTNFSLLHGEAVGLGMIFACYLSESQGYIDATVRLRLTAMLKKMNLPIDLQRYTFEKSFWYALLRDKKSYRGTTRWILLQALGQAIVSDTLSQDLIKEQLGQML